MKWVKAAAVGVAGGIVVSILMHLAMRAGIAPFNLTPSAALLERLGFGGTPLAVAIDLAYGAAWSIALVATFRERTDVWRGIGLGIGLWLLLMVVYSPIIGWGSFGLGRAQQLPADHLLYLAPGPRYMLSALVLHVVYGAIVGWLNPLWMDWPQGIPQQTAPATGPSRV